MTYSQLPMVIAAVFAISLALPLRWWTLAASALAIAVLTIATIAARSQRAGLPAVAAIALSIVGAIVVGYAAYALMRPGAFGPVGRLGYPFLVATGLRLDGGAWLVMLVGLVSVVPILFSNRSA